MLALSLSHHDLQTLLLKRPPYHKTPKLEPILSLLVNPQIHHDSNAYKVIETLFPTLPEAYGVDVFDLDVYGSSFDYDGVSDTV